MDLLQAAAAGDLRCLRERLAAGADLDAADSYGRTPLMAAVLQGHLAAVRLLIEAGADLDLQDENRHTALMHATSGKRADIVEALVRAGADVRIGHSRALDFAVRFGSPEMARLLLAHGADVDRHDEDGRTPLVDAADGNNLELVRLLLAEGASTKGEGKPNPLVGAARHGNREMMDLLLEAGCPPGRALAAAAAEGHTDVVRVLLAHGSALEEQGTYEDTALARASLKGHAEVVALLIEAGANREHPNWMKRTPLALAASEGHREAVRVLLEAGADTETRDDGGETPLQDAAWAGRTAIVRLLLEAGADPNAASDRSPAPLFWAVSHRRTAIVRLLLQAGADPNQALGKEGRKGIFGRSPPGTTPLMIAAALGQLRTVERLLGAGARLDAVDSKGRSAAVCASRAGRVAVLRRLAEAGAEVDLTDPRFQTAVLLRATRRGDADRVRAALASGADPNGPKGGETPLLLASLGGQADLVRALLAAGAAVNHRSPAGLSPLCAAVARRHTEVVRELLAAGADVRDPYPNVSVPSGTANTVIPCTGRLLCDAAFYGHADVVDLLLAAGADVNAVTDHGQTALLLAVQGKQFAIARRLLAAGARARPEDAVFLAPLEFLEAADTALFRQTAAELAEWIGVKPEPVDWLPGAMSFRLDLEDATRPEDPGEAARQWMQQSAALNARVGEVFRATAPRVRERGFLLIDAGKPMGCGPMVQFLFLVPTSDKYAVLAVIGVHGNERELSTADIIAWFRDLERQQPFELRGCRHDAVDIEFTGPVNDPERWAARMYDFCPDLIDQGFEKMERLVEHLRTERRVHFWWD